MSSKHADKAKRFRYYCEHIRKTLSFLMQDKKQEQTNASTVSKKASSVENSKENMFKTNRKATKMACNCSKMQKSILSTHHLMNLEHEIFLLSNADGGIEIWHKRLISCVV